MNTTGPYRELTVHRVNPLNDQLKIEVMDKPGAGGACHYYLITLPAKPSKVVDGLPTSPYPTYYEIEFQNGPIAEAGINGLTHEVLLAILLDRLECFQKGEYACIENETARHHLEQALWWLQQRTRDRMARGVEGTSKQ